MISVKIGKIGKDEITFHQIETSDNLKELGLPEGTFFFWENEKGEKIFSPYQIIVKTQKAFKDGTFDAAKLLTSDSIKIHYKNLYEAQKKSTIEGLQKARSEYVKMNAPKEAIDLVDEHIKTYSEGFIFPDIDGVFRPESVEQVAQLSGGMQNLKMFYSDKEIQDNFGGVK